MAETNLTTTITSEEYKMLIWNGEKAHRLAQMVAADWLDSTDIGFNEPSKATKAALQEFDPFLYLETKRKVEEAEAARKNAANPGETIPGSGNPIPVIIPDTTPGWPYQGVEITCEAKGETT